MRKRNFVMLVMGVIGGVLFSLGLCMCLLPEWEAFWPGVVCTGIGLVLLLILLGISRKGKKVGKINWKNAGKIAFGVAGALVMGVGMCLIMVWEQMLWGILVGVVGIFMLLCLIPMFLGLK